VELRGVESDLAAISITVSGRSLTKTPTVVSSGGRTATMAFARSGRMYRGLCGQKLNPSASAPSRAASRASWTSVMPQIFTRTMVLLTSVQQKQRSF